MPLEIMKETDGENEPQRRSARLSPTNLTSGDKMAPCAALAKRRITVRKIAPRKTTLAPSEHDKENTPKREAPEGVQLKKHKLSTPDSLRAANRSAGKRPKKSSAPSPILPSPQVQTRTQSPHVQTRTQSPHVQTRTQSPHVQTRTQSPHVQTRTQSPHVQTRTQSPHVQTRTQSPHVQTRNQNQQVQSKLSTPDRIMTRNRSSGKKSTIPSPILPSPLAAKSPKAPPPSPQPRPADEVWSQKVRRSYSRLSDKSLHSPDSRLTFFGFDKLQTPEVIRKDPNGTGLEASGSFTALTSFTSLLEAELECAAEPDLNIPGVRVVKERRRRKKVQQIDKNELDELAAKMNAEFEEAEEFELFVE